MGKINLLSSKIYNRISAGEVVERPFSVVKELVENAIDAKSTNIVIEIVDGGISSIKITDNGQGIEKDDLKKALLPHATSKISKASDLDNIITLGFRGEALASIASVSKIQIVSKPKNQEVGASIYAEGGDIEEVKDFASCDGTEITVRNLFFNTPAREKFLKTKKGEESDITSMVSKFILGNPSLSFKYIVDGKTIYQSFGDGLESALITVYGNEIIENCFKIDTNKNGIGLTGYIGKQFFTKSNKTYQTTFINGRFIVNQTISTAIYNAYASYLMKRQYPFYVINISLPTSEVDVNVHPNKIDVRFSDNHIIYSALYSTITKILDGSSDALNIVVDNAKSQIKSSEIKNDYVCHNVNNNTNFDKYTITMHDSFGKKNESVDDELFKNFKNKPETPTVDIFAENKKYLEELEKQKVIRETNEQQTVKLDKDLKFIGQALNTFLVFDDGSDLYMIDQHAVHERLLYDKFINQIKTKTCDIQPLLIPYVFEVNPNEFEFLSGKIDILNSMGIEISDFGGTSFKISALPTCLIDLNIKIFFNDLLSDLNELKGLTLSDILKEKIAQKACKSAIKSGDKLDESEIKIIADSVKNNLGLKCPHGRPVAVKITRTEIDKWFKRIV